MRAPGWVVTAVLLFASGIASSCVVENGGAPPDDPGFDAVLDDDAPGPGDDGAPGDQDRGDGEPGEPDPGDMSPDPSPDPGADDPAPEEPGPEDPPSDVDLCTEGPNKDPGLFGQVYFGTDTPDYLTTMTAGQIKAIGTTFGCSGTIVTAQWVLTADHCGLSTGDEFCIGDQPGSPNVCFDLVEVHDHPQADLTVAKLDVPVAVRSPDVVPIGILLEDLSQSWVGRTAEAAGYGEQENGQSGRREFTDEIIDEVNNDELVINGQGISGVCWGDSGGPVMVYDAAGDIRVAGALSWGDPSCVDRDRYTRTDLYRDWIIGYTGPPAASGPQPCGTVSVQGKCNSQNTTATYCGGDGDLVVDTCGAGEVCGFEGGAGWRCMPPADDPCQGAGTFGTCQGGVLSWCTSDGVPETRDCGSCGETCELVDGDFGYGCTVSACGDVDYLGTCQGDTAVWCSQSGELRSEDCGEEGLGCGWVNDSIGFYCTDA